MGGTNAHLVLEEAPKAIRDQTPPNENGNRLPLTMIPVSGKTEATLDANLERLAESLRGESFELDRVASSLQFRREAFRHRAFVIARSIDDLRKRIESRRSPTFVRSKASSVPREVVFMFPGQGSQYVRMGQGLYRHSTVFRDHLDQCAELLQRELGRDLRDVMFPKEGDEEAAQEILRNTRFTQPALFSLGYSLAKTWLSWGITPSALIGHSIGEFAAACIAGVFELEDGLKIIAERGRRMEALPGGSMMSVRLPGAEVEPLLWGEMAIGSFNGPRLCVVSGPDDQVSELREQLERREIVCRPLHTSHAFHSPMMDSIVSPFSDFVSQLQLHPPTTPICSTVTGDWLTDRQATDPTYWANHLRAPVRFSSSVERIWSPSEGDSSRILLELGPRRTLATLARQHASNTRTQLAIPTLVPGEDAQQSAIGDEEWQSTVGAIGQLWCSGVNIDWSRLSTNDRPVETLEHVTLPTYAFQRKRYFVKPGGDSSHGSGAETSVSSSPSVGADPTVRTAESQSTELTGSVDQCNQPQVDAVSRIPEIIKCVQSVFENTSGLDPSDFEDDVTFFEMGLDSLVLTQTASALKKELEVEVSFRQLLEQTTTIEELARWFDEVLPREKFSTPMVVPAVEERGPAHALAPESHPLPPGTSSDHESESFTKGDVAETNLPEKSATETVIQLQLQAQLQLMQQQLQALGAQSLPEEKKPIPQSPPTTSAIKQPQRAFPESTSEPIERGGHNSEEESNPGLVPRAKRFKTVRLSDSELDDQQQESLNTIIKMTNQMMPRSKKFAQENRSYLADPRTVSGFRPNMKEMTYPIVVERSKGVRLWDIDGNEYIDFTCGFGSNLLGHTHEITTRAIKEQVEKDYAIGPQSPLAGEVARLFCELTGSERMAFSNTGSEAVLGCTRLARNATGRDLIVMFNGDYHGILDEVIARGSKKLASFPAATGIPKKHVENTLILDYGSEDSLRVIESKLDDLAAILVEPVQSRRPELQPKEFLKQLASLTKDKPTALIFDEVITGFRIGLGGAQEHFGVKADLASYGKIVGGGMPIGILAGRAEYMDGLDGGHWSFGDDSRPETGMTYYAGTFVRHPLTLAASKAILTHLKGGGKPIYDRLNRLGDYLASEMNRVFESLGAPLFLANFGSLFKVQFKQDLVYSELFFAGLRRRGMHIWDNRPCLLTLAHRAEHVGQLVAAARDTIIECQQHGFMPGDGYQSASIDGRPPQVGAELGRDEDGRPAWFIPDTLNPGQYLQVGSSL